MPVWTSPDLLAAFKREVGLNDANEYDDTTDLYPRLARAQVQLIEAIASRYPNPLYSAPFALTPSADRTTFSFGTDAQGQPILPLGWVQISPNARAFIGDEFVGWVEGTDFLDEGTQIRVTANRTFTGTLYCRAVLTPPDIAAAVDPVIQPVSARALIAVLAARDFAGEGAAQPSLVAAMQAKWNDPLTGFPALMLTYRRRYRGGGALLEPRLWYRGSPDLTA